jgi:exodeoxyribonuclease VII large subunit
MENRLPLLTVSDFIAISNQVLDSAFMQLAIEGEVASFTVNQGKYVFFDLKDAMGTVNCFMTVYNLRQPIENGMRIVVQATPKVTRWGKFSLTVRSYRPIGEGSIGRSFELLRQKLTHEGLFDPARKRPVPEIPRSIGVISSTQAAGYKDFIKIVDDRWRGIDIQVAHVRVQGDGATDHIIRALAHFNVQLPDVVVILRGGGSADDLSVFNDELLVRSIAASRVPVMTGIGHEVDTTLSDLAADIRAATPSDAARRIVPERRDVVGHVRTMLHQVIRQTEHAITEQQQQNQAVIDVIASRVQETIERSRQETRRLQASLDALNPSEVLRRGYAIMRGEAVIGSRVVIEQYKEFIEAEVRNVTKKI